MRDADDDVDLVVSAADDGLDEDLPEPRPRDWSWLRRWRLPVGVLAAAALAVGIVVAIQDDSKPPPPSPRAEGPVHSPGAPGVAHPSGTAGLHIPRPDVVPTGVNGEVTGANGQVIRVRTGPPAPVSSSPVYEDPMLCHPVAECALTHQLPPRVLAAVREVIPGAQLDGPVSSVVIRDPARHLLWQRSLHLATDHVIVTVDVGQPTGLPESLQSQLSRGGAERATSVSVGSGGYTVNVSMQAKVGYQVPAQRLVALARDPRLEAVV